MFTVRAVTLDHYLSKPLKELCVNENQHSGKYWQEPVLRIFGSTADGVKCCVHVHGVYPYIYVPFKGGENPDREALLLGAALDEALKTRANQRSTRFVYKVTLVSGTPLYGYHSKRRQFFKIFFYNPNHVRRAADLLLLFGLDISDSYVCNRYIDVNVDGREKWKQQKRKNGSKMAWWGFRESFASTFKCLASQNKETIKGRLAKRLNIPESGGIFGQKLQPHEAHIPYVLQFMIDYNIYGMNLVHFSKIKYRRSPDNPDSLMGVDENDIFSRNVKKMTWSRYEVDALAKDIVNRYEARATATNPGLRSIWEEEKARRRAQERTSQITVPLTQCRPNVKTSASEIMHKERLAKKLRGIYIQEPEVSEISSEPRLSYPAEVPDCSNILEATALDDDAKHFLVEEDGALDVKNLIDENILSQFVAGVRETSENEEEERIEADSVLGRNQKEEEEEEAELEDEDDVDMTQPLDAERDGGPRGLDADPEEQGNDGGDDENENEEFWKNVADKIFQLDGAHDSSSDSDPEVSHEFKRYDSCENFPKTQLSDETSPSGESLPHWSDNIMSILSEDSVCPTPTSICQTPRTFWSNYLTKADCCWSPACQEPWDWNEKDPAFAGGDFREDPTPPASSEEMNSNEAASNFLRGNGREGFGGNRVQPGPLDPHPGSPPDASPSSGIRNPADDVDFRPADSVSGNAARSLTLSSFSNEAKDRESEKKIVVVPKTKYVQEKTDRRVEKLASVLSDRNGCDKGCPEEKISLTLNQYIKDCGEIVNVDFKNLNNRDMIIVEYKPFGKESSQSKFLIKPLDTFLENWTAAEKKVNNDLWKSSEGKRNFRELIRRRSKRSKNSSAAINPLEHECTSQWLDSSKVKSVKNKFVVKSMEILPENCELLKRRKFYKIDENLFSEGNIKMKLVKSNIKNSGKEWKFGKFENGERAAVVTSDKKNSNRVSFSRIGNLSGTSEVPGRDRWETPREALEIRGKCAGAKRRKDLDAKLISEINSSFEKYYRNVMRKVNEECGREGELGRGRGQKDSGRTRTAAGSDDSAAEDSSEDSEETSAEEAEDKRGVRTDVDPAKFVSELVSTFSRMSKSSETPPPPMTITICLGDPVGTPARPTVNLPEKKQKAEGKKQRSKIKIENVDGPADGSSSEDSPDCDPKRRKPRKKIKRETFYRPLNIILQNSIDRREIRRKRKFSAETVCVSDCRKTIKSGNSASSKRGKRLESGAASEQASSDESLPANLKIIEKSSVSFKYHVTEASSEHDFICDSDKESKPRKMHPKRNRRKADLKTISKGIPQADVDVSSDSGSDNGSGSLENGKKSRSKGEEVEEEGKSRDIVRAPNDDDEGFYGETCLDLLRMKVADETDSGDSRQKSRRRLLSSDDPGTEIPLPKAEKSTSRFFFDSPDPRYVAANFEDSLTGEGRGASYLSQIQRSPLPLSGTQLFKSRENSPPESEIAFLEKPYASSCSKNLFVSQKETKSNIGPTSGSSAEINFGHDVQLSGVRSVCDSSKSDVTISLSSFGESTKGEGGHPADLCDALKIEFASKNLTFSGKNSSEDNNDRHLSQMCGSKIICPLFKPPGVTAVREFLSRAAVLETLSERPHYGDPRDLVKATDVGPRTSKVESLGLAGLRPHSSALPLSGIEEKRAKLLGVQRKGGQSGRSFLVPDKNVAVVVVPLRKPPSPMTALKWSKMKSKREGESRVLPVKRKILILPLSPGQERESEEEMNVSVIPSIPEDESVVEEGLKSTNLHGKPLVSTPEEEPETNSKEGLPSNIKGAKRCYFSELETVAEDPGKPVSQSFTGFANDAMQGSGNDSLQIRGVTFDNTFGFKNSVENMRVVQVNPSFQHVTMLVVELHVESRKDLRPDPRHDAVRALFYTVTFDSPDRSQETGIVVVGDELLSGVDIPPKTGIHYVSTEVALFGKTLELVRSWDPDILAGYEIEMHSWGYLVQRGFHLEMNLLSLLGRVREEDWFSKRRADVESDVDEWDDVPRCVRHMRISGRIVLDVWRVLRHEIALTSYTFENVMYHLSHERHPVLPYKTLSWCWEHSSNRFRHVTVEHYVTRVVGVVRILDQLDFVNRTSELSRLFGIQFYEVLSRGSQFRVESMMLRLAKPLAYIPVSPSVAQRAAMRAPASLPLIMEPESLFYADPLVVLDFQSLYPSMIIAYNYCFSTCLGRVEKLGGREPFEFGCTQLQISPEELKTLEKEITISPVGVAFVNSNVRRGVLPSMLEEILETRLMVKKSMKENKNNKILEKVLHARQLGLKLIANVTYGYTAANFSGRMPCIEVGDSVVSKGRETLERAIQLVKSTPRWGAKVVYGDTDSIFLLIPGKTRREAFEIGSEIADAVTQDNPRPVKLKLEKVYQPSILQTKKRYVGYMYENPEQEKPIYEAKGIETVRRDGCPATAKILQKALQILFDTKDVSLVKKYAIRQFAKLFEGRVNTQDLIFAKEYRGRKGYRPGACVPALHLAKQWRERDKRAEPRVRERVPYVVVNGPPGVPLIRLVRSPKDLMSEAGLRLNAVYYVTKAIIPAMQRCFSLLGADVASWYAEIPRRCRRYHADIRRAAEAQKRSTISQYFSTVECVACSQIGNAPICPECQKEPQKIAIHVSEKVRRWERSLAGVLKVCQCCCGRSTQLDCESLDCPVLFRRHQARRDAEQAPVLRQLLEDYLQGL